MGEESPGLGRVWPEVMQSIKTIAPFYDKVNRMISLGSDRRLRVRAVCGRVGLDERVLDAGAGNGVFTTVMLEQQPGVREVVMLDILPEMLSRSGSRWNTHPVLGDFERTPFRDDVFDSVLMGFSLRDARDMKKALDEVRRVMTSNGKLVVVDLGKPDNRLKNIAISLYWRTVAPLLAFLRVGLPGLKVYSIHKTYVKLPKNSEFKSLLKTFFRHVEVEERMMGGTLIALSRAKHSLGSVKSQRAGNSAANGYR
ncbi:MAG: class I SAM-dependent methyltransferase [Candidatus Caldarchaeum sp.]